MADLTKRYRRHATCPSCHVPPGAPCRDLRTERAGRHTGQDLRHPHKGRPRQEAQRG